MNFDQMPVNNEGESEEVYSKQEIEIIENKMGDFGGIEAFKKYPEPVKETLLTGWKNDTSQNKPISTSRDIPRAHNDGDMTREEGRTRSLGS